MDVAPEVEEVICPGDGDLREHGEVLVQDSCMLSLNSCMLSPMCLYGIHLSSDGLHLTDQGGLKGAQ